MVRSLQFFILAAALGACSSPSATPRNPLAPISVAQAPYKVAVLDEIHAKFPDGRLEVFTVEQTGALALPEGTMQALGQPPAVVERRARDLIPGASSVTLREFRPNRVTVLGEVFHQIHTDIGDGPMRLMDAIASANGFTPIANKRRVKLLRENAGRTEVYEFDLREMMLGRGLDQNFLLEPGDVITVPRNFL